MTKKIEFTDRAKEQIDKIIEGDQLKKFFRISVKGGGCSGFKYNFSFDDHTDSEDIIFDKGNTAELIKNSSLVLGHNSTALSFAVVARLPIASLAVLLFISSSPPI